MKQEVAEILHNSGMIPVFYHGDPETCKTLIKACYEGGARVVEYMMRGETAMGNFPALKEYVQRSCPGMIIGAGTIMDRLQAKEIILSGADFIVSPIVNQEIADVCNEHDIYWIPGCATPTEINMAITHGADIIKVFPGNVLGPDFIKSVLGPMPGLKLMPSGGVEPTKENLKAWFDAGVVCVGMGSKLIGQDMIADPDTLSIKVKEVIEIINMLTKNND